MNDEQTHTTGVGGPTSCDRRKKDCLSSAKANSLVVVASNPKEAEQHVKKVRTCNVRYYRKAANTLAEQPSLLLWEMANVVASAYEIECVECTLSLTF